MNGERGVDDTERIEERHRRFELLAVAEAHPVEALAEKILADTDISVLVAPRPATLMVRHTDPVADVVFNFGELLVTEARVALGEAEGYAMRIGHAPETTLAAAILDVVVAADHPAAAEVERLLSDLDARNRHDASVVWATIAPTRVVFDEMR